MNNILIILFLIQLSNGFQLFNKISWQFGKKTSNKIILRKSNIIYTSNNITDFSNDLNKNNIVISTAGGIYGIYMLGSVAYIQQHYKTNEFLYSGISAGSWISLLLSHKNPKNIFINKLLNNKNIISNNYNFKILQKDIKNHILENYKTEDFNLSKLYIGVTHFKNFKFETYIYSDFYDLEDALNCCIASSNIPFITGNIFNKYNNLLGFDGGFSEYPYIENNKYNFTISPNMWNVENKNGLSLDQNITKLFESGFLDTKKNYLRLDNFFDKL
jgi:hypothetical protein